MDSRHNFIFSKVMLNFYAHKIRVIAIIIGNCKMIFGATSEAQDETDLLKKID